MTRSNACDWFKSYVTPLQRGHNHSCIKAYQPSSFLTAGRNTRVWLIAAHSMWPYRSLIRKPNFTLVVACSTLRKTIEPMGADLKSKLAINASRTQPVTMINRISRRERAWAGENTTFVSASVANTALLATGKCFSSSCSYFPSIGKTVRFWSHLPSSSSFLLKVIACCS